MPLKTARMAKASTTRAILWFVGMLWGVDGKTQRGVAINVQSTTL